MLTIGRRTSAALAWCQAGIRLHDEPSQHPGQVIALGRLESAEELVRGVVERLGGALLNGPAARSEAECIRTAIGGVPPADHCALALQLVDQLDHRGAVDPE